MLILSIDTSCNTLGVSLTENGIVLAECAINNKKTHSVKLMPTVNYVLEASERNIKDVSLIAVVNGPGSFTGLRIGVSCAKALSYTLDIPVIGVSTLDYLARSTCFKDSVICPIIDARNKQVYYCIYEGDKRISDYSAGSVEELCKELLKLDKEVIFTGDGVLVHRKLLKDLMGDKYREADPVLLLGKPSCMEALVKDRDTSEELTVFYLRKSQAERLRDEKNENSTNE